jgi:hypothetical protein
VEWQSSRSCCYGVIATLDVRKRSAGLHVLLGCTPEEATALLAIHQVGDQSALLMLR